MENENSPLVQLNHIKQAVEKIHDELKDLNERLQAIEGISGIDCGEITASNS